MKFEERLIDLVTILESENDIENAGRIVELIGMEYGYHFELTGDGNWIFKKGHRVFEAMFDSSRGGDILISIRVNSKDETVWENPHNPRKILKRAIAFMKCEEYKEEE
jgi:hypothetical protein